MEWKIGTNVEKTYLSSIQNDESESVRNIVKERLSK